MTKKISKKGECIRRVANFSKQNPYHKMDRTLFDKKKFLEEYPIASPKLDALIKNIQALDEADRKKYGTFFKHVIYTDVKSSSSGSKMIAAGLLANGYLNAYDSKLEIDTIKLENNKYHNFALLSSVPVYNKPFSVRLRRKIITMYNDRPKNINGKYIRFLLLDQGFKEGIDVFDVKYVHLFEPLLTKSDEKQAIGRATRFCGQKGLDFNPLLGWPLHVYKYEIQMNERQKIKYNSHVIMELFMKHSGLDVNKLMFANELETISRYGAIDYELNIAIHDFGNEIEEDDNTLIKEETLKTALGMPYEITATSFKLLESKIDKLYQGYRKIRVNNFALTKRVPDPLSGGGIKGKKRKGMNINIEKAPQSKLNFVQMRKYVYNRYKKYTWDEIKFENLCLKKEILSEKKEIEDIYKNRIIEFTPTQEFISRYFNNTTYNKGMLLWHSVGTGKTCSAVATATRGFEPHGYTILWVTRHTLKPDIWKNIFNSVCSLSLQRKIKKGEFVPEGQVKGPLRYLSKNWLMPISYKQFSNMLLEKNKLYYEMKKRNGNIDPLKKTLVIIDEVHKLYSSDLPIAERPNLSVLKDKIKSSYKNSKEDSVRLLLMTATPYTNNPMDLIKMLNLIRDEEDIPEDFDEFRNRYLNDNSIFTKDGSKFFLDEISGYISYLNRERDARQFSYPVFYNVKVPMSEFNNKELIKLQEENNELVGMIDELEISLKTILDNKEISKMDKKLARDNAKIKVKQIKDKYKENKKQIIIEKKKIKQDISQEENIDNCLKSK